MSIPKPMCVLRNEDREKEEQLTFDSFVSSSEPFVGNVFSLQFPSPSATLSTIRLRKNPTNSTFVSLRVCVCVRAYSVFRTATQNTLPYIKSFSLHTKRTELRPQLGLGNPFSLKKCKNQLVCRQCRFKVEVQGRVWRFSFSKCFALFVCFS